MDSGLLLYHIFITCKLNFLLTTYMYYDPVIINCDYVLVLYFLEKSYYSQHYIKLPNKFTTTKIDQAIIISIEGGEFTKQQKNKYNTKIGFSKNDSFKQ